MIGNITLDNIQACSLKLTSLSLCVFGLVEVFLLCIYRGKHMKHKNLILFISLVLFLYPVIVSGAWTPMSSGTTQTLYGVWGSSGSDVFAVGSNGTILHYNGSTWSSMTSGTTNALLGVWGSSGTDVFAVGGYSDSSYHGTILHYNGSTWSAMPNGAAYYLYGVWGSSADNIFVVGGYAYLDTSEPPMPYYPVYTNGIFLHYNGSSWSSMPSGTAYPLYSIWGSSADDIFAVGGYSVPSYETCICQGILCN